MTESSEKMFQVSKHLGELNKIGMVKGFQGNSKGHAKIKEACRGCSIWFIHQKNDELLIALMVSISAKKNYKNRCIESIKKFKDFCNSNINQTEWLHSIDKTEYDSYSIAVTKFELPEILSLIDKVKIII